MVGVNISYVYFHPGVVILYYEFTRSGDIIYSLTLYGQITEEYTLNTE